MHGSLVAVEVPTVIMEADEYQLLFSFWPRGPIRARTAGAHTLWRVECPVSIIPSIKDLNYLKSRPILLFPVVSSFIGATMSFESHIFLCQAVPLISDLNVQLLLDPIIPIVSDSS